MGWHWGILASSGGAAGSFELLQTTVLGTAAASVTFSNLGNYSAYKHLQIRAAARSDRAGAEIEIVSLAFNNDSGGTTYANHRLRGDGTSVTSAAEPNFPYIRIDYITAATAGTNVFGSFVTDILDFSNTSKNTTTRTLSGFYGSSVRQVQLWSGVWMNTNAVTEIDIAPVLGTNFVTGSRFSLYGIK